MQALPRTLSIILAMAAIVGTTSFSNTLAPRPAQAMDEQAHTHAVRVLDAGSVGDLAHQPHHPGRERYVISGDNVTLKQMFDLTAEMAGIRAPFIKVPSPAPRVMATGMELVSRVTGTRPLLDRAQVDEFAGWYANVTPAEAQRELRYTHRPVRDVLRRTVAWFLDSGFVDAKRRAALSPHASLAEAY